MFKNIENKQILVISTFVLFIVFQMVISIVSKKRKDRLADLLIKGDFDNFDKLSESFISKFTINGFNLIYMKLNRYIAAGDNEEATKIFDFLAGKKLKGKQKSGVDLLGYNFFLELKDEKRCEYYHDEINNNTSISESVLENINKTYDIIILKKTDRLDTLLSELDGMDGANKGFNEFLISEIYKNMNDETNSSKYLELSKKHIEELVGKSN